MCSLSKAKRASESENIVLIMLATLAKTAAAVWGVPSRPVASAPQRTWPSAVEIAASLSASRLSASDHAADVMERARACAASTNSFISLTDPGDWQRAAARADERFDLNTPRPLEGLAIALKDVFASPRAATTCASSHLRSFRSPFSATVTKRLVETGGGLLIGKTNLDEFSMGRLTFSFLFSLS